MKKRGLALMLSFVMIINVFSPMTVHAANSDDALEGETGVEDSIFGDESCKVHDWSAWKTVLEPTCTEEGSETRSCKKCGETATKTIAANGHTWDKNYTVDVEATCTTNGSKSIHCSVVGCLVTQDSQVITKLGHDFKDYKSNGDATCAKDGTKTAQCTRCTVKDTLADTGSKKAHTYATSWNKDDSEHWHACTGCGDKSEIASHNFEGDICSVCDYQRAHVHDLTLVKAVDATCTTDGSKEYYTCSGCDRIFADKNASTVIGDRNTLVVDALGHAYANYQSNNDATCTADGTKTGKCSRCNVTNTITDEGSAKGHSMTKVAAVAATCEEKGNKEYYTCSTCSNWFEDLAGKKQITDKNSVVINASGHTYAAVWSKDKDNHWHECEKCFAKKDQEAHTYTGDICSKCNYEKAHEHQLTQVKEVAATCTTDGSKAYYTCTACDSIFEDADGKKEITDKSKLVVAALNHSFKNYKSNGDASCTADGTKTATCERCSVTDTVQDTGSAKGHKASSAWSKDDTAHWHVCTNCNAKMDQASHNYTGDICSACGYEKVHVHQMKLVKAVDATCEKEGNVAYYKCSGCDSLFEDAEGKNPITDKNSVLIPASGHKFTTYTSDGNASCTSDGTKTARCERCTKTDTVKDTGSAKGHNFASSWSKDAQTHWHACTACGAKAEEEAHVYAGESCSVCGYEKAHVHELTLVKAKEATCESQGNIAYYACTGCDGWFTDAEGKQMIADRNSVILEALGHRYDSEGICERCGQKDPDMPERAKSAITFVNTERTVSYSGDAVELTVEDVEVKAGDGEVTFAYYTDKSCTVPTYAENAKNAGSAPVDTGRYYVKAKISGTYTYEADTTDNVFTLTIRPRKVSGATAVNNKSSIKLSWKKRSEADGYIIYRRKEGSTSDEYKAIKTITDNTVLTYSDKDIKQGTGYIYTIRAYADAENGSRIQGLMMSSSLKIVRTKITSIANQDGSVKIKWTQVEGAEGYKVYRKSSGEDSYRRIQTIKDGTQNYYVDKSSRAIKNGKASYYYVIPYYAEEDGYVLSTNKKTNYYVSRATVSSVTAAKKAFTVKWKTNSKASGYEIRYSTSKDFDSYEKETVTGKSNLSKKISGLKAGKKYYVKVRAYKTYDDVKYYSAWSAVKSVKTK